MDSTEKGLVKMKGEPLDVGVSEVINIIGDPGCDGLGAGIMSVFARALAGFPADFSIIVGDMVPYGSRDVYANFTGFVNTLARHPVFTLKGNHDTDFFNESFGSANYALTSGSTLLISLDNTGRCFTTEALDFCRRTLAEIQCEDIIFLFHYPPPNPVASNSINPPEWELFREIYAPFIKKIRYFISGHVHSLGMSQIDGIPVIITGGAGARLESLDGKPDEERQRHHIIQLRRDTKGCWNHTIRYLEDYDYQNEIADSELREKLEIALDNEVKAHFRYALMARKAEELGKPGLAGLFHALSDSEFHHAMNHESVLNGVSGLTADLEKSIRDENYEVSQMYREYTAYADRKGFPLSRYTFNDAWNAEKVHENLLKKALESAEENRDIPESTYYTCTSCGYTFEVEKNPVRCPVCGAPGDKIRKVS